MAPWVPPLMFCFVPFFLFFPSQNSWHLTWNWECDSEFEEKRLAYTRYSPKSINWVDWVGNSVGVGTGVTVLELSREKIDQIYHGDKLEDPTTLQFRDTASFHAGEVHNYYQQWQDIIRDYPSAQQVQVLKWIRDKVSIFEYFQPFSGSFEGKHYCSDHPPSEHFRNNVTCKPFADLVRSTLLDWLILWGNFSEG